VSRYQIVGGGILAIHAALLAWGATCHSPAFDEVGHLPAGLGHWQQGRFDLYEVNPPLVRLVAALPVLAYQPAIDWDAWPEKDHVRYEFGLGRKLMQDYGERCCWYFVLARWVLIPFSLVGGYVCWCWASDLFGQTAGLLALTLWCFCPLIVGNAQMITPDTGAAALGVAAHYVFWRWLKSPAWTWALFAGFTLGLAELTKFTWVIFFPLWPALWLAWRWPERDLAWRCWIRQAGQLVAMLSLALFLLNAGYLFKGSFQPLKKYTFQSQTLSGRDPSDRKAGIRHNRFRNTLLGELPMPVPHAYLVGIDMQKKDFEDGYWSYFRGEWRHGGWWYYYLYGLAVKVPLGTWLLALLAIGLAVARPDCRAARRDELFLLIPFVLILTLVSSQTGFNHHLRYILPILPFAFILISRVGRLVVQGAIWLRLVAGAALTWTVVASLTVFPHNLSYFNELVGGPAGGGKHLLDSNIDWGQDVILLRDWLRQHPEATPLGLAYFGAFDPSDLGIEYRVPPLGPDVGTNDRDVNPITCGPQPGWYAISVTLLYGYSFPINDGQGGSLRLNGPVFTYFQRIEPVARAGYSINIYHVSPEEANRVRDELGLPRLSSP
jgi:hypothetical protein